MPQERNLGGKLRGDVVHDERVPASSGAGEQVGRPMMLPTEPHPTDAPTGLDHQNPREDGDAQREDQRRQKYREDNSADSMPLHG
jgi:hypothetical protein